ncbi:MAG TPA: FGGY-family carbohydrate kinase, partial [Spirochaetia bacterium]
GTRRIGLSGGGARSVLWPQIFADVFGCEVSVTDRAEHAGLLGVLVTTGRALGWQKGWLPPRGAAAEEKVYRPEDRARGVYDRLYGVFRGLYPALRGSFAGLARIETEDRA